MYNTYSIYIHIPCCVLRICFCVENCIDGSYSVYSNNNKLQNSRVATKQGSFIREKNSNTLQTQNCIDGSCSVYSNKKYMVFSKQTRLLDYWPVMQCKSKNAQIVYKSIFQSAVKGIRTFLFKFFIGASATKSFARSRIFRCGLPNDILRKGLIQRNGI